MTAGHSHGVPLQQRLRWDETEGDDAVIREELSAPLEPQVYLDMINFPGHAERHGPTATDRTDDNNDDSPTSSAETRPLVFDYAPRSTADTSVALARSCKAAIPLRSPSGCYSRNGRAVGTRITQR